MQKRTWLKPLVWGILVGVGLVLIQAVAASVMSYGGTWPRVEYYAILFAGGAVVGGLAGLLERPWLSVAVGLLVLYGFVGGLFTMLAGIFEGHTRGLLPDLVGDVVPPTAGLVSALWVVASGRRAAVRATSRHAGMEADAKGRPAE